MGRTSFTLLHTEEMQKLVGDAFAAAFKNKKVSVRHNWKEFTQHPFGEYWDSWAHLRSNVAPRKPY